MNTGNTAQLNKNTSENESAKSAAMPPAPKKWKLMFVSWLFVYPVINIMFAVVFPLVKDFPQLGKTLVFMVIFGAVDGLFYSPVAQAILGLDSEVIGVW
jgi:antibiotic biosynthesis monooxygenase (ABM) superfamily enzyme